jgi:hypothetical protein
MASPPLRGPPGGSRRKKSLSALSFAHLLKKAKVKHFNKYFIYSNCFLKKTIECLTYLGYLYILF